MSRKSNRRVAIIGGGLSGLATAVKLRLADDSLELSLFEAGDRVGGVIDTERQQGFLIDHGADMFAIKPAAALELCQQLGLEDRLIEPEPSGRGARIVRRGRLMPIPSGFVVIRATQLMPMLSTPLLSIRGKLRFLAERWVKPAGQDNADESVGDFVRRRMGSEVLERIVAPLAAGIYTADISKLSMQATMGPIAEMERQYGSLAQAARARRKTGADSVERGSTGARYGQFRAFQGGMIELIRGLADTLPESTIHLNRAVHSIRRDGDRWTVTTPDLAMGPEEDRQARGPDEDRQARGPDEDRQARGPDEDRQARGPDEDRQTFDHVVVAVPPQAASRLLHPIAPLAARQLEEIESASTAIVVLGVRRADIKKDIQTFGFVVPLSEQRRILAGSFASHKFAGRAPQEHTLIRVFIGGAMQPELLDHSDDELVQIARDELGEIIGLEGSPVVTRVVRWNQAMPQYHVGHRARVEQIEKSIAEVPGLTLVSNALHGVGIAPLIQLADRSAKEIVASFTPSSDASRGDGIDA